MVKQTARLVGGAGTGKTRELVNIMCKAREPLGGSPFSIGFASFTRAARQEAAERTAAEWGLPEGILTSAGWFRTCHSTAYRQLGVSQGELLTTNKESQAWIAEALGVDVRAVFDPDTGSTMYTGDRSAANAINAWELSRARIEPLRETVRGLAALGESVSWSETLHYTTKYERAKRAHGRFDYSDLLSRFCGLRFTPEGIDEVDPEGECPPSVRAWVFDEAQDSSALVNRVCLRLAAADQVQWVYLAGDPFQSVFSFGGSDSKHFMGWKADRQRVMQKSWRCPKPVLELGERCLRMMRTGYWDREIAAADHDGVIERSCSPSASVSRLDPAEKTLIISRCKFTLNRYREVLEAAGLPFGNLNDSDSTQALRGYRAYWDLEHGEPVSGEDLACAISMTPVKSLAGPLLRRGVKSIWAREDTARAWDMVLPSDLPEIGFEPDLTNQIAKGAWAGLLHGGERWRSSAKRFGPDLATSPHIRLGTIHSTKGMEGETVVLSTETTRRIDEAQELSQDAHDEERRVEYVGITRARRRLIISDDPANYSMRLPA